MILVINCGSQKTPFISEMIDEFMDAESVDLKDFDSSELSKYKGIVISGAPILITEVNLEPYKEKFEFVLNCELPILGICFGHQMIGLVHGAFGSRMKEDRDWQTIEIFEDCPLFKKLPSEIEMMEDHCESISIPPNFKLIGSSDACVNEAMQHQTKKIYGVQFHPEVSGNHGRVIFENFVHLCE
jgi:GMP synthase (glutamine-hydrolysing)